ncbi:MAG TPA: ABC transporter ATP-binding protein [Gemmatimonadales bacterium]|jgi:ABC-2 type transport system ATP-binding protein
MTALAVSARALTRSFGSTLAVDRVSFDVQPGELFGLVGPDGAGKTTTLRMLSGVMRPTSGDATILGVSVTRDPAAAQSHLSYVAQRFGLYGDLTVRENIDFYADLYGVPTADRARRIDRLYAFSGLGPFERRLAGALSGGMKQKLSLCSALIHEPALLVLDEPTFGVDPISRRDLWLIIHEMVARGMTVVVSTAYMDEAERCDRLAMLHHGRLVAADTPAALQRRLEGRLFELHVDRPRAARDILRTATGVRRATLFGDAVHVTLHPGVAWELLVAQVRDRGVHVGDAGPVEASLEDIFMELGATDAT